MGLFDEFAVDFDAREFKGFYDVYRFHADRIIPLTEYVRGFSALFHVLISLFSIGVMARSSSTSALRQHQMNLVAQILLSCAHSLFIHLCGVYGIATFGASFTFRGFGSRFTPLCVACHAAILIGLADICAYATVRSGLVAKHAQVGGLSHVETLRLFKLAFVGVFVVFPAINYPLFLLSLSWDQQESIWPSLMRVDPRLDGFLLSSSPYFMVFHKVIYIVIGEVLLVVGAMMILAYFVIFTSTHLAMHSPLVRRLQRKVVVIQVVTLIAFVVCVIFPITSYLFVFFNAPDHWKWYPVNLAFFTPMQWLNAVLCLLYLTVMTPYRNLVLESFCRKTPTQPKAFFLHFYCTKY